MYDNLFTNIGSDGWNRPLIVDAYDRSFPKTIRVPVHPSNIPVVDSTKYTNAMDQAS